jgi:hypothetical protein
MRFGSTPTGGCGWLLHRDDFSGPTLTACPEAFEEARSQLVRLAFEEDVDAVLMLVDAEGVVVRTVLDR